MRKFSMFIVIITVFLSSTLVVSADLNIKDSAIMISDIPASINVGDTIEITAITLKKGSGYIESWENAAHTSTNYDPIQDVYISKAVFTVEKAGIYNISYTISMNAGKSDTVFTEKIDRVIEVIDNHIVVGAAIEDITITPIYNSSGNISVYRAVCTVYAVWSNDTKTKYETMYFFFSPNETSKEINVSMNINGNTLNYIVNVTRDSEL